MTDFAHDREIERARYNARAARQLGQALLGPDGAVSVPLPLRTPYERFERLVEAHTRPGSRVLDVCCGDGIHALTAARRGAQVTVADLAEINLEVASRRAARAGLQVKTLIADAEQLPLANATFDLVTCVGSLSYVRHERFIAEVHRVLRPGGAFIFVDSLNHNWVYRFNRWIHHLRGRRSRSTLERMPTCETLAGIQDIFPDLEVTYHGILSFLAPALSLAGHARVRVWLDGFDRTFPRLRRHAFKIVAVGHKS